MGIIYGSNNAPKNAIKDAAGNYVSKPGGSSSGAPSPSSTPANLTRVQLSMVDSLGRPVYDKNTGQKINYGDATSTLTPQAQGAVQPTGSPQLDAILASLNKLIEQNVAAGNTVNPNLNITPELASKFIADARAVVDPYTQQLINEHIADINANLSSLAKSFANDQASAQAQFQQAVGGERENASSRGIVFSGVRGKQEQGMVDAQNRALEGLQNAYSSQIGNTLRAGGQALGSGVTGLQGGQGSFQLPNLVGERATLAGPSGGVTQGGALSYGYDPNTYKTGTISRDYNQNVAGQANQFLSNYLTSAANNGTRSFQQNPDGSLKLV